MAGTTYEVLWVAEHHGDRVDSSHRTVSSLGAECLSCEKMDRHHDSSHCDVKTEDIDFHDEASLRDKRKGIELIKKVQQEKKGERRESLQIQLQYTILLETPVITHAASQLSHRLL